MGRVAHIGEYRGVVRVAVEDSVKVPSIKL